MNAVGSEPLLAGAGLVVGYRSGSPVLVDAGVRISRGSRLAILGTNGSGKTTLLRTLSGSLHPKQGQVTLSGQPLEHSRRGLLEHRRRVQLVLQDPDDQLFSADVFQDVSFGPMNLGLNAEDVRERVTQTLALLEIADLGDRPVHHLSFGQRKRVALAGAVAMRPEVLLLDEPTAGLDPVGVRALMACFERLEAGGTTIVLSTHEIDMAWSWADEVAVLADRRVTQLDVVEALTDDGLLARTGLRPPWQVDLLRGLGCPIPVHAPRTTEDVVAAVAAQWHTTSEPGACNDDTA